MNLLEKTGYKVTPLLKFKDRPLKAETSFIWTMTALALAACSGGVGGNVADDFSPEPTDAPDDTNYAAEPSNFFYGTEMAEAIATDDGYDGASYEASIAPVTLDLSGTPDETGYTSGHSGGYAEGDKTKDIHHIYGTRFKDILMGDEYPNWIYGAGDDDQLFGYGENDSLFGATGNDFLEGGAGADSLDGGRGSDWAIYKTSPEAVTVDLGVKDSSGYARPSGGHATGDRLINIENIAGSQNDDTLIGDGFNNIIARLGSADIIDGGRGNDWVDYSASKSGVTVDLSAEKDADGYVTAEGGHANGDRLKNIENIKGTSTADILIGDDGHNQIQGGKGLDTLTGNGGRDIFILNPYGQGDGAVLITDFTQGEDKIRLLLNREDYDSYSFETYIRPRLRHTDPDENGERFPYRTDISLHYGQGDFVHLHGFIGTLGEDDFEIVYSPAADIA